MKQGLRAGPGATWAYRMLYGTLWLAGRRDEATEAARMWKGSNPHLTPELMAALLPKWSHDPKYFRALQMLWTLETCGGGEG